MSRKPHSLIAVVFVAALATLTAATAFAQTGPAPARSVLSDYRRGEAAVKDKKWDEAIAALTAAVNADPKDRQYRDGVVTEKYFPHNYLFIAYMEKGDVAKARENLALRGAVPQDLASQAAPYMARVNAAPAGPAGTPSGGGTAPPAGGGTAPPAGGTTSPAGGGAPPANDRAVTAYNAGIAAMKASRWQDAITAFNNAIRADAEDKPRADVPDGYFPHYYLAIANLRANHVDEASSNFDKRGTVAKTIYLADEEVKFPKELDFARYSAAGDEAFGRQQLTAAVDGWQKACAALPDECNSRGYRQKLTDAQATIQRNAAVTEARTRVTSAQQHVAEGDFDGAKREFQAALGRDPNNADAAAGAKAIQTKEDTYNAAKARGDQAQKGNKLDDAAREFEAARVAHAQWFARDKLDTVVASINETRMKTQGISAMVAEAQKAFDGGNFASARQIATQVLAQESTNAAMKALIPRSESRILFEEGRKMYAAGDFFQADAKYRAASDKDPAFDAAQKAFTQSSSYLGFVGQKAYAQAQKADPVRFAKDRPDQNFGVLDLIRQANENFASQNLGSASRQVDEALKLDPENKNAIGLRNRIEASRQAAKNAETPVTTQPTAAPNGAPLMPMWMWAAMAGVTLLGAGSLLTIRGRAPTPLAIDSLPWGRVSIQRHGKPVKAAPAERVTPFLVNLPPGEYELRVASESMSQPYTTKVTVIRGQQNKIVVTNPAYDVDEIVSSLLG